MKLHIIKENEVDKIASIIEDAKKEMAKLDMDQWQKGYPNRDTLLKCIENKNGYTNDVANCFAALVKNDRDYGDLINGDFVVVHTMVVDQNMRGTGLSKELFKALEEETLKMGIHTIGMDTHPNNKYMLRFIENAGFVSIGEVYIGGTEYRVAFKKEI